MLFFLGSVVGIPFVEVLVLEDLFVACGFHFHPPSSPLSRYNLHGALTLMSMYLAICLLFFFPLLLYPPCVNACRDLKPHEWASHHVRRRFQRPPEVSALVGTPDPMVTTPFMFLHFSIFVPLLLSCFLIPPRASHSHGWW